MSKTAVSNIISNSLHKGPPPEEYLFIPLYQFLQIGVNEWEGFEKQDFKRILIDSNIFLW